MKKILFAAFLFTASLSVVAQGNGKGKNKVKSEKHGGTSTSKVKYSKNQPKKVEAALLRDYPAANNVVWSKYKGDYTATFNNGPWRSTAVYHANGDRRDTRTVITQQQLPNPTIWDRIFKRDNVAPTSYIQIERPTFAEKVIRVLTGKNTAVYYDEQGNKVQYDY